ncbi:MAG: porphobilinogen synthase, partial [Gammaproteobacteria bacterium]|nr:porphobilinogen synthase [Gammaproteobacteria bacterium]
EYTDHGHCGVLHPDPEVTVDNDRTLQLLGEQAVALARNGADVVAPSGMMDGQVAAIRAALERARHDDVAILSYTTKYASSYYGPFREAGEGAPSFGDRRGYQMDYRRSREWATELALDTQEGADMVMVKPAMTYLDIIRQMRDATALPLGAYHVSGEYSQICAAAERGWIDLQGAAVESTYAMKRAGADLILTYFADRLLDWL